MSYSTVSEEGLIKASAWSTSTRHLITATVLLMGLPGVVPPGWGQQKPFAPQWVKDAIFYQIFPERFANGDPTNDPPGTEPWGGLPKSRSYFGGDLQGIIDHLDYISSLGINTLYLNPIFASNSNHKYFASDYLKVDPHFGDEATFKRLVEQCHAHGLRIILDGVFNHTGVDFFAFQDIVKNGARSRYLGWYNIYSLPVGPASKPNYECWWGYGDLPKLMTHNPDVKQYLFDATRHWMELGIDGWRLDVPNEIPHGFWIEWRQLVKSVNPQAYIVGEIWDDATPWLKGDQFDAVMNYRFRHACLQFFQAETSSVSQFDSALSRQRSDYPADVNFVLQNLIGSHDTERFLTLCSGDTAKLKLATLFQMTYVGAPMVYYGDEIGMVGGKDPDCRRTMVWDEKKQDRVLLETFKQLIKLRNEHQAFRRGTFQTLLIDDKKSLYAFERREGDDVGIVVLNNSAKPRKVEIPLQGNESARMWKKVWPGGGVATRHGKSLTASVPARTGAVYIGGK